MYVQEVIVWKACVPGTVFYSAFDSHPCCLFVDICWLLVWTMEGFPCTHGSLQWINLADFNLWQSWIKGNECSLKVIFAICQNLEGHVSDQKFIILKIHVLTNKKINF